MVDVRRAAIEDVAEVGRLHVKTWQSAYRGEMPDAYLDGLSADDRAEMWRRLVEAGDKAAAALLVAEDDDGAIVGFACFGPSRNEQGAGELSAMNVDPQRWRSGVGAALLEATTEGLQSMGFSRAVLWTGESNERARRFYEANGWHFDGQTKTDDVLGATVREVRYSRDLAP